MLAFRTFCDNLPKEEADKCAMILHTEIRQDAGTDLVAIKEAFCPGNNIYFSAGRLSPEDMNLLYNISATARYGIVVLAYVSLSMIGHCTLLINGACFSYLRWIGSPVTFN